MSGLVEKVLSARISQNDFLGNVFTLYLIAYAAVVSLASVIGGYSNWKFTEHVSERLADGWCDTSSQGVGVHCFGDFGVKFTELSYVSQFEESSVSPADPPAVLLVFRMAESFSYNQALIIWLAALTFGGAIIGALAASSLRSMRLKLAAILILGFGNLGFIGAFDRGNPTTLVVGLALLGIFLAEKTPNQVAAGLTVGVAALFKFWSPIFVFYFLVRRNWLALRISLAVWTLGTGIGLVTSGVPIAVAINRHFEWLFNGDYSEIQIAKSHSVYALLQKFACLRPDVCLNGDWPLESYSRILIGAVLLALLLGSAYSFRKIAFLPAIPIFLAPLLALPDAMIYNLALTAGIGSLLLIMMGEDEGFSQRTKQRFRVSLVLVLASVFPIPIILGPFHVPVSVYITPLVGLAVFLLLLRERETSAFGGSAGRRLFQPPA